MNPPTFTIMAINLDYMSVCTDITDVGEIERRANEEEPTGVSRWKVYREPRQCKAKAGMNHWLLSC